jgi:hypothetical protein
MSSVSCVRMADSRVVCALSCESRSCVCEERSAKGTALPDFNGRADPVDSERDGRVALRYAAGSKWASKKGASAGSDTCDDFETVFSAGTAMMPLRRYEELWRRFLDRLRLVPFARDGSRGLS